MPPCYDCLIQVSPTPRPVTHYVDEMLDATDCHGHGFKQFVGLRKVYCETHAPPGARRLEDVCDTPTIVEKR